MRKAYNIVKGRYYILFLKDITNVKCLKYYFASKQLAKDSIKAGIKPKERKWYKVVSGHYLKKYEPNIYRSLTIPLKKYRYPEKNMTDQERKSHRTLMRRRLRRMNVLVESQPFGRIYDKAHRVKFIKNKQKVANSPNSMAKVINIDRRGAHRFYLLHEIKRAKRTGDLFRMVTTCFNLKTKTYAEKELRVKNTDIITPYLEHELRKKLIKSNFQICDQEWYKLIKRPLKRIEEKSSKTT